MQELVAKKEKKIESNVIEVNVECFYNLMILLSPKACCDVLS
jgi:hypothetical protein